MEWLLIILINGSIHTQTLPHVRDCPAIAEQINERHLSTAYCILMQNDSRAWQEWLAEHGASQTESVHEHPRRGIYMLEDYSQGEKLHGDMFSLYWDGNYPTNFDDNVRGACFNNDVKKGNRLTWDDLVKCETND